MYAPPAYGIRKNEIPYLGARSSRIDKGSGLSSDTAVLSVVVQTASINQDQSIDQIVTSSAIHVSAIGSLWCSTHKNLMIASLTLSSSVRFLI